MDRFLHALLSGISFLTSVTGCQRLLFSCCEICWFCSLKAEAYTSSEGGDYALRRLFVAPQDTAALPACQGLFSTQISCPPARRADILAPAACPTFQRSLWERLRGFAAVYSRGEGGISSWCWHGGCTEQASVALARNTCLCLVEGWSGNEHISLSFYVTLFHSFPWVTSHLPGMLNSHEGCPEVKIRIWLDPEDIDLLVSATVHVKLKYIF